MITKFIRLNEVMYMTGLGRSSIYKFMGEGHFPKSIYLSARAIAWQETEIQKWIESKIRSRTLR